MRKKVLLLWLNMLLCSFSFGQWIDNYGLTLGANYTTQKWEQTVVSPYHYDHRYKAGGLILIFAEKEFSHLFSSNIGTGYIQKGLKEKDEMYWPDGTNCGVGGENLVIHNLGLDVSVKVTPWNLKINPYARVGIRNEYRLGYKDIIAEEPASGLTFPLYESYMKEFKKYSAGALMGIGIAVNETFNIEVLYNPNFTNTSEYTSLTVRDVSWELVLGLNIH